MFPKKALSIAKHLLSNLTDPKLLNGSVYCYTQVVWISRPSSSGYFTCVVQHNQTFPATRLMLQISSKVTSVIYVLTKVINSPHSCFFLPVLLLLIGSPPSSCQQSQQRQPPQDVFGPASYELQW